MSRRGPRFTEKEKLTILKKGEETGVKAVCAGYGICTGMALAVQNSIELAFELVRRLEFSLAASLKYPLANTRWRVAGFTG